MNKFAVLIAVCGLVALATARQVPRIPCTYIAKIEGKKEVDGKFAKDFNFMQYSIENAFFAQEGYMDGTFLQLPEKVIVNMTEIRYGVITNTYVGSVFDHHTTCARLPVELPDFPCFVIQENAKVEEDVKCPNSRKRCDHWFFEQRRTHILVDWYLLKGTNTPVQYSEDNGLTKMTYNIITFDLSKPDMDVFMPPDDCNDFTHGGTPTVSSAKSPVTSKKNPERSLVNDYERIAKINAKGLSWKAAPSKEFEGMTVAEFRKKMLRPIDLMHMNQRRTANRRRSVAPEIDVKDIPEEFDASKKWPKCGINVIRDQEQCGSCWAFGSSESLGDRFCIAGNQSSPIKLSPQYLVDCFVDLDGCGGGLVDIVWEDLMKHGTVEDSCLPYRAEDEVCPTTCKDGSEMKMYKAKNAYPLYSLKSSDKTVEMIQKEIMTNGPVEAAFWVFDDFMNYHSGVYHHPEDSTDTCGGGHAVKIYGWGVDEESGLPYWLVANSWGNWMWGEGGSFRILRGNNECGFEDSVVAGLPLI